MLATSSRDPNFMLLLLLHDPGIRCLHVICCEQYNSKQILARHSISQLAVLPTLTVQNVPTTITASSSYACFSADMMNTKTTSWCPFCAAKEFKRSLPPSHGNQIPCPLFISANQLHGSSNDPSHPATHGLLQLF